MFTIKNKKTWLGCLFFPDSPPTWSNWEAPSCSFSFIDELLVWVPAKVEKREMWENSDPPFCCPAECVCETLPSHCSSCVFSKVVVRPSSGCPRITLSALSAERTNIRDTFTPSEILILRRRVVGSTNCDHASASELEHQEIPVWVCRSGNCLSAVWLRPLAFWGTAHTYVMSEPPNNLQLCQLLSWKPAVAWILPGEWGQAKLLCAAAGQLVWKAVQKGETFLPFTFTFVSAKQMEGRK